MMIQQVMTKPGQIEFKEVDIPKIKNDEVLVKIMRIGICGSDIHVYHGLHPFTKYPITQGHEVSGEIVEIPEGMTDLYVGQHVTIEPQIVCGKCYPCRNGKYNLCEDLKVLGFQMTGAASQYFAVSKTQITPIPKTMSFDDGAMIEPLAVTVHAANRFNELKNAKVAILGCGPIGILLGQTCKALGADKVLITDISDTRLKLASECGIDYTINTKNINFGQALLENFGEDKADVIYDCAGNDITMGESIKYSRKGSTIILVAVYASMANIDLAVLNDKEITLDTSMMYRHEDYIKAIELIEKGKIKLKPLVTKHFDFKDYLDAYKFIEDNREETIKVLIDVG